MTRVETKKAYGLVMALGTKLGERAKTDADLVDRVRQTNDIESFRSIVRASADGVVPAALVASFLDEVVTPADWMQWRSRLLLQMKLTREGGKPAPGHEKGKGVGKP